MNCEAPKSLVVYKSGRPVICRPRLPTLLDILWSLAALDFHLTATDSIRNSYRGAASFRSASCFIMVSCNAMASRHESAVVGESVPKTFHGVSLNGVFFFDFPPLPPSPRPSPPSSSRSTYRCNTRYSSSSLTRSDPGMSRPVAASYRASLCLERTATTACLWTTRGSVGDGPNGSTAIL